MTDLNRVGPDTPAFEIWPNELFVAGVFDRLYPYEFPISLLNRSDAGKREWCRQVWGDSAVVFPKDVVGNWTMGIPTFYPGRIYLVWRDVIYFRHLADAAAFRLAWG